MKQLKYTIFAVPAVLLLVFAIPNNVQARWGGPWGYHWGNNGGYDYGQDYQQQGAYQNAYTLGQQDAVYDHTNNLAYNPVGQCIPCHSQEYWDNFKQGYNSQWNSYTSQSQEQTSTQGASINIYGNNYGTASIGQSNTQGQTQNPLQQLTKTVCGFINCNQGGEPGPDP